MISIPRRGTNMGWFRNVQTIFSSDSKSERVFCEIQNAISFREHAGHVRNGASLMMRPYSSMMRP
jgi:hypothetical protein